MDEKPAIALKSEDNGGRGGYSGRGRGKTGGGCNTKQGVAIRKADMFIQRQEVGGLSTVKGRGGGKRSGVEKRRARGTVGKKREIDKEVL